MELSGQLVGRDARSGAPLQVEWSQGRLTRLSPPASPPPEGVWIAPSLLDLQINGFAGVDFQGDDLTLEELLRAARALRRHGCARWLLTLITDSWPRLTARLRHLQGLRARSPELRRAILGFHLEGPFLSAKPGFCGTHPPDLMCDPTPEHLHHLRDLVPSDPLLLTIAPERPGALPAIELAIALGLRVSLGHTDAPEPVLQEAIRLGATGFTHLANGCPQQLDRHDNILWRVLANTRLTASLIPDGIHVSPDLFRLLHRLKEPGQIYYTTDAMSAAGAPPGRYRLGPLELEVGPDRVVRRPGSRNLSGSAITPIEAVWKAAALLGEDWRLAWSRLSDAPARFLGVPSGLVEGAAATFVVLRWDEGPHRFQSQTWVEGQTDDQTEAGA